jgi:hypothetical protein
MEVDAFALMITSRLVRHSANLNLDFFRMVLQAIVDCLHAVVLVWQPVCQTQYWVGDFLWIFCLYLCGAHV